MQNQAVWILFTCIQTATRAELWTHLPCIRLATTLLRMATTNEEVANAVKEAMAAAGSSHRKICEATGIASVTLNRRLNANRTFTVEELLAIADHLGVPASSLLPDRHSAAA